MLYDRVPDLNYASLVRAAKRIPRPSGPNAFRLALLSDASVQHLSPLLRILCHRASLDVELHEGGFDSIELESFDSNSPLYRFRPDAVVVLGSVQALRARFYGRPGSAGEFVDEEIRKITRVWDAIAERSRGIVLQSNFVLPCERQFGNLDQKVEDTFYGAVLRLNAEIARRARGREGVLVQDVEFLASWAGRRAWFDDRLWDLAKTFCALDTLPLVAQNIVDMVVASRGRVVKCLVLDLDNTLWGGVIGDDGLDGIRLNAHGDGEGFYRFQQFLRELTRRGILLAVCSKNDPDNARLPFEKHPYMVLKLEHIAVFVANWQDKAENIRAIRETLNIGFDSMVFVDDSPFERNLVRELAPGVIVPEMPEDPSDYVRALCELNLFETTSHSEADAKRTEQYRIEAERRREQASFANLDDFLASLDMRIVVNRFDGFHLPRIAQLFQRSNQFNLTTRRRAEPECRALLEDSRFLPLYVELSDRLGDHGLISVVVVEECGAEWFIRDWLMSCRVLTRGVEQYLMNHIVCQASARGITRIHGEYIPTAKNAMVRDFFAQFGFQKTGEENGSSHWSLEVGSYQPAPVRITAQACPQQGT